MLLPSEPNLQWDQNMLVTCSAGGRLLLELLRSEGETLLVFYLLVNNFTTIYLVGKLTGSFSGHTMVCKGLLQALCSAMTPGGAQVYQRAGESSRGPQGL